MNTSYDSEATQYQNPDNEATQYDESTTSQQADNENVTSTDNVEEEKAAKWNGWKRTAMSAGTGLLIGSVATVLMGMKKNDAVPDKNKPIKINDDKHPGKESLSHPEWVDDDIKVATSVNDDMSFGEAFAAARAEVGPGGVFEWHGQLYGTYTADEWNSMTAEQKAEYGDHFSWNHIDHSSSQVAQHSTTAHQHHVQSATTTQHTANNDDIEVVSINHPTSTGANSDPEIEILGVVHDDSSNANIGGMIIDGQEVILIDVDNDLKFDYMAADTNSNGKIDQNEMIDIRGQNLTVNDMGGFTNPTGDLYADNAPDYSNDGVYEG